MRKNIVMLNLQTGYAVDMGVWEFLMFIGPARRIYKFKALAKLIDGEELIIRGYKFYIVFAER